MKAPISEIDNRGCKRQNGQKPPEECKLTLEELPERHERSPILLTAPQITHGPRLMSQETCLCHVVTQPLRLAAEPKRPELL
ncbi:MAG: hypothetical protein KGM97_06005, partial [Alphaproteobacteria bacterium]|nr:hypothetical protein [Alphaproteobacteria bacterium]